MSISTQLREAICRYGTMYAVSRDSGIAYPILHRFVRERRDLHLETADRLCKFFGLGLAPIEQKG